MADLSKAKQVLDDALGKRKPSIGIVLGSGLGSFADALSEKVTITYDQLPGIASSTVSGHAGQFVCGKAGDKEILVMQGRLHYYEGISAADVVAPVRLMGLAGIESLVVTNSAGGLNKDWRPGTLMLITDHVRLQSEHPLRGPNDDDFGPRFPDMTNAYTPVYRELVRGAARDAGIQLQEGIYVGVDGPSYETPAEVRFLKMLGGDAVGMSTVPEVIAARHMGLDIIGISCITNLAAGLSGAELNHAEVKDVAAKSTKMFIRLLMNVIDRLQP